MTKKWTITQNIIATILQAWALFFLYFFTDSIFSRLGGALHEGIVSQSNINYVKMFGVYNTYYLSGILAGYGGLAMLYDKKWGWLASIAASLTFMVFMLMSARTGLTGNATGKAGSNFISYFIAGFAFAAMAIVLTLKPFRVKYQPTFLNWVAIAGVIIILLIDKQYISQ